MPQYYTASGDPATDSDLESAPMRAEFTAIEQAFAEVATAITAIAGLSVGTASGNLIVLDANKLIQSQLLNIGTASGQTVVLDANKLIATQVLPFNPGTASGNVVELNVNKLIDTALLPFNPGTASGNVVALDANKFVQTQLLPFNPGTASGNVVALGADKLISTGLLPIGTASGNLVQLDANKFVPTQLLPIGTASGNLVSLDVNGLIGTTVLPFNPGTASSNIVQLGADKMIPTQLYAGGTPGTASGNLVELDANKFILTQLLSFNPGTASGNVVALDANKLVQTQLLPFNPGTASGNVVELGADKMIPTALYAGGIEVVISSATLGAVTSFSAAIPSGYQRVEITVDNLYGNVTATGIVVLRINDSTASAYDFGVETLAVTVPAVNSAASVAATGASAITLHPTAIDFPTSETNAASFLITLVDPSGTHINKIVRGEADYANGNYAVIHDDIYGRWKNSGAITTVNVIATGPTFVAGAKLKVYGKI